DRAQHFGRCRRVRRRARWRGTRDGSSEPRGGLVVRSCHRRAAAHRGNRRGGVGWRPALCPRRGDWAAAVDEAKRKAAARRGGRAVMSRGTGGDSGSVVLAVAHGGTVVRQLETRVTVGRPAVVGHYVFLPWQGQFVTVYNLQSGEEEARLLFRQQVSRAFS